MVAGAKRGRPYQCSGRKGTFEVNRGENDTKMWSEVE